MKKLIIDDEIEVGKTFKYYDGCINLSKEYEVTIRDIIPFNDDVPPELLFHYGIARNEDPEYLSDTHTDYFLIGDSNEFPEEYPTMVLVRKEDNIGWVGIGPLVVDIENDDVYCSSFNTGIMITKRYSDEYESVRDCLRMVEEDRLIYGD